MLLRRLLWSASGAPAVASFFRKSSDHQGLEAEGTTSAGELLKLVAVQAGVALALSAVFSPLHYLLLWALPLLTIAKLCTVLRLLCEHSSPDKPYVWRTFAGNALERNLLGSFGLNYHAEHHIYPTVPYENLPTVFALYSERLPAEGRGDLYEVYEGGHLGLLRDWFRALPWRGGVTASDS